MFLLHYKHILEAMLVAILIFWSIWTLLISLTDTVDFIHLIFDKDPEIHFNSKNSKLIEKFLLCYNLHHRLAITCIYGLIIAISYCITIVFWMALFSYFCYDKQLFFTLSCWAFFISLAFNGLFILIDEIFIQYKIAHNHMIRLSLHATSFILFLLIVSLVE